jgi:hypothetical protein
MTPGFGIDRLPATFAKSARLVELEWVEGDEYVSYTRRSRELTPGGTAS